MFRRQCYFIFKSNHDLIKFDILYFLLGEIFKGFTGAINYNKIRLPYNPAHYANADIRCDIIFLTLLWYIHNIPNNPNAIYNP